MTVKVPRSFPVPVNVIVAAVRLPAVSLPIEAAVNVPEKLPFTRMDPIEEAVSESASDGPSIHWTAVSDLMVPAEITFTSCNEPRTIDVGTEAP